MYDDLMDLQKGTYILKGIQDNVILFQDFLNVHISMFEVPFFFARIGESQSIPLLPI